MPRSTATDEPKGTEVTMSSAQDQNATPTEETVGEESPRDAAAGRSDPLKAIGVRVFSA